MGYFSGPKWSSSSLACLNLKGKMDSCKHRLNILTSVSEDLLEIAESISSGFPYNSVALPLERQDNINSFLEVLGHLLSGFVLSLSVVTGGVIRVVRPSIGRIAKSLLVWHRIGSPKFNFGSSSF